MVTKQELYNLIYLSKDIGVLENELEALYTKLEGVRSPVITDMPRGGVKPDIFELYDKLFAKQNEINALYRKLHEEKERIQEEITILSYDGRRLIKLRYFEKNSWSDIAEIMGYSLRHLHRLHSSVLFKLKNK